MTLVSSRGIIRASKNSDCELLAAMALEAPNEKKFYEQLTGEKFQGEYGERNSARRRGAQFEDRLHANNAALLKAALSPLIDVAAGDMWVRDFVLEYPGPVDKINAVRLKRFWAIMRDLADGRPVPDLLIQPTLTLSLVDARAGAYYISPDFLVFDRKIRMYRVGELKSFIKRDRSSLDPKDLDNARRQVAIGILALADEAERVGLTVPDDLPALMVFATPYGLTPSEPHVEQMLGEIEQVRRGIDAMRRAVYRLVDMRGATNTSLANLADDLKFHYRESCIASCLLAKRCREKLERSAIRFGDAAARVFGDLDIETMKPVLYGDPATLGEVETNFRARVEDAARVLGVQFEELRELMA